MSLRRLSESLMFCAAAVVLAATFSACTKSEGIANPSSLTSSSQSLSASEVQAVVGDLFGSVGNTMKGSVSAGARPTLGGQPASTGRQLTVLIPARPMSEVQSCPMGGSFNIAGTTSGTYNTDTDFANITGTTLISHSSCSYRQGHELSGDPYMSGNLTYTSTGGVESLRLTMSGAWALRIAGRGITRFSIDPAGLSITMGSTAPCRIQGSITASPGGSFSVAQGC